MTIQVQIATILLLKSTRCHEQILAQLPQHLNLISLFHLQDRPRCRQEATQIHHKLTVPESTYEHYFA